MLPCVCMCACKGGEDRRSFLMSSSPLSLFSLLCHKFLLCHAYNFSPYPLSSKGKEFHDMRSLWARRCLPLLYSSSSLPHSLSAPSLPRSITPTLMGVREREIVFPPPFSSLAISLNFLSHTMEENLSCLNPSLLLSLSCSHVASRREDKRISLLSSPLSPRSLLFSYAALKSLLLATNLSFILFAWPFLAQAHIDESSSWPRVRGEKRGKRREERGERMSEWPKTYCFMFDVLFVLSSLRREKVNQQPQIRQIKVMIFHDPHRFNGWNFLGMIIIWNSTNFLQLIWIQSEKERVFNV